jgi:hypothetical protein
MRKNKVHTSTDFFYFAITPIFLGRCLPLVHLCIDFILRRYACNLIAVLYTNEFQKCTLPYGHIIFWVSTDTSEPSSEFIDSFISAEIADLTVDPPAYALVAEYMVHGAHSIVLHLLHSIHALQNNFSCDLCCF